MEREINEGLTKGEIKMSSSRDNNRYEIMKSIDANTAFSEKAYMIGVALVLGIIFDYFFRDKTVGVSVPIYIFAVISFFLCSNIGKVKMQKSLGWFLLIPIVLLSMSFAIYSNDILAGINILVIPFLMVCSSILIFYPKLKWDSIKFVGRVFDRAVIRALENCYKPVSFIKKEVKITNINSLSSTKRGVIKGLAISLPLLIVILLLLTSADMVFNYYMGNMTNIFKGINLDIFISHVILIGLVFFYLFGYVWSFRYDYVSSEDEQTKLKAWEPSTVITVVFMLNVVYLLFTMVQFSYLYGGGGSSLPQGFTYAEYARKGFFELVAVTVINFAVILSSMSYMTKESKKANFIASILLTILIFFTFNMLYSANYKMSLYEVSYGYTYLRVFVHYFMLLLAILLVGAVIGIWYRNFPMAKTMIITALTMYVILNYLNVDVFIARKNIERYKNGENIDIAYLTHLSYDAFPYVKELLNDKNEDVALKISQYVNRKEKVLESKSSWSEFNLSKYNAMKSLR
jgi:hypothetical protein